MSSELLRLFGAEPPPSSQTYQGPSRTGDTKMYDQEVIRVIVGHDDMYLSDANTQALISVIEVLHAHGYAAEVHISVE